MVIVARSKQALYAGLARQASTLIKHILQHEDSRYVGALYTVGRNTASEKAIETRFNAKIEVPTGFELLVDSAQVVTFGRTQTFVNKEGNSERNVTQRYLLTYLPMSTAEFASLHAQTDSIGNRLGIFKYLYDINRKYFVGENSAYLVEDLRAYWTSEPVQFGGLRGELVRCLWRIEDPFMGGPLLVYYAHDPKQSKLWILQGVVYGAGTEKKPLVREMEVIAKTLKLAV